MSLKVRLTMIAGLIGLLIAAGSAAITAAAAAGPTRVPRGLHEVYFAEGTTREGFDEYVCISNPGDAQEIVNIRCFLDAGAPAELAVTVPARSRMTLFAPDLVGRGRDVSMRLTCDQPFSAERPIYFTQGGISGSHCIQGIAAPSEHWYFAEGYTGPGFREYLCVMDPAADDATVRVTFTSSAGETRSESLRVPACTRRTLDVGSEFGQGKEVAAAISSTNGVPVVAERPMYFDAPGATGGHCSAGQTLPVSRMVFAEGTTRTGFREFISISNPGAKQVVVGAEFLLESGDSKTTSVEVPAMSRRTIDVNRLLGEGHDASAVLTSDATFCAERPMYFDALGTRDGHCGAGAIVASRSWSFAEGTTRPGFRPFFCISNAESRPAAVHADFFVEGVKTSQVVQVPANSRVTIDPSLLLPPGLDFTCLIGADRPVVAESVQYCDAESGRSGGQCALGDAQFARARFGDVATYVNTYGSYQASDIGEFEKYDVATLEPYEYPDASFPAKLRQGGCLVLGYIDIGEAEDYRSYWPEVLKHPEVKLAKNPDWPGSWYANVNSAEWRRIILEQEIPYILKQGPTDGLFLDMLDSVDEYPRLKPGMIELVREIREWYPDLLLMPNRGFGVLAGILPYIDAFKYEEMTSGYDFTTGKYVYARDDESLAALEASLAQKDIPVFVLDHVSTSPLDETMARTDYDRCQKIARETGRRFIWYANSVEQDHPHWAWLPYR